MMFAVSVAVAVSTTVAGLISLSLWRRLRSPLPALAAVGLGTALGVLAGGIGGLLSYMQIWTWPGIQVAGTMYSSSVVALAAGAALTTMVAYFGFCMKN